MQVIMNITPGIGQTHMLSALRSQDNQHAERLHRDVTTGILKGYIEDDGKIRFTSP